MGESAEKIVYLHDNIIVHSQRCPHREVLLLFFPCREMERVFIVLVHTLVPHYHANSH